MKWILRITPYLVLVLAGFLLVYELRQFTPQQITSTFQRYSWSGFAAAMGLLVVNYFIWSFYDWIGLRQLAKPVPYVQIFRTTSVAFPITNLAGYSLITGMPIRLKNYEPYGVNMGHAGQVILFNIESWWLGFLFLCGAAITQTPIGNHYFSLSRMGIRWMGICFLLIVFIYLIGCMRARGRMIKFRRIELHFPSLTTGTMKLLNGILDNLVTAYTFYVFLPEVGDIPFSRFLALFLVANLASIISMVPGGLGVMEGMVLLLFKRYATTPELLSSMFMFRLVHYLIPLSGVFITQLLNKVLDRSEKPR